ncbi:hypothetical protein SAMN04489844_2198 [Nocardioides exalbidus]|uniref:Uncharacterized protein n=1 Tax=Nocardioides exalbidus TaxID=402596 RepID=A0A1H4S3C3_9ACTN|nr:hypothetical protein [Nocardioides exalbidus]SEC38537.1 hypothetical protein SAMN04489844_2198 [Nocardioides exalbidus]
MISTNSTAVTITADVTNWPTSARTELLELIDRLSVQAVNGPTLTHADDSDDYEPSGWNGEAFDEIYGKLLSYPAQAAVILRAISSGTGFVSRDDVYELAKYEQGRSLKGFTRPIRRLTQQLIDKGILEEEVDELLETAYDQSVKGYQRALGFRVPMEVVKMAHQWQREGNVRRIAKGRDKTA